MEKAKPIHQEATGIPQQSAESAFQLPPQAAPVTLPSMSAMPTPGKLRTQEPPSIGAESYAYLPPVPKPLGEKAAYEYETDLNRMSAQIAEYGSPQNPAYHSDRAMFLSRRQCGEVLEKLQTGEIQETEGTRRVFDTWRRYSGTDEEDRAHLDDALSQVRQTYLQNHQHDPDPIPADRISSALTRQTIKNIDTVFYNGTNNVDPYAKAGNVANPRKAVFTPALGTMIIGDGFAYDSHDNLLFRSGLPPKVDDKNVLTFMSVEVDLGENKTTNVFSMISQPNRTNSQYVTAALQKGYILIDQINHKIYRLNPALSEGYQLVSLY